MSVSLKEKKTPLFWLQLTINDPGLNTVLLNAQLGRNIGISDLCLVAAQQCQCVEPDAAADFLLLQAWRNLRESGGERSSW